METIDKARAGGRHNGHHEEKAQVRKQWCASEIYGNTDNTKYRDIENGTWTTTVNKQNKRKYNVMEMHVYKVMKS